MNDSFSLQSGYIPITGWLGLLGLIIKNAIVLIDEINMQHRSGVTIYTTIIEARVSIRCPMLMTVTITIFGLTSVMLLSLFTTAFDEYAIRAFSVNSIDYILKPIDEKRLLEAIIKYETLINKENAQPEDYLDTILESLQRKEKRYRSRFLIYGSDKFWTLQVSDIAYFYTESKVTFAVTHTGKNIS